MAEFAGHARTWTSGTPALDIEQRRRPLPERASREGSRSRPRKNIAKARTRDSMQALEQAHRRWWTASGGSRPTPPLIEPDARTSLRERGAPGRLLECGEMRTCASTGAPSRWTGVISWSGIEYVDAGPQGGRGGQRGNAGLDRAVGRPRPAATRSSSRSRRPSPRCSRTYAGRQRLRNAGHRVVAGQRLMQAASDIFLGWQRVRRASTAVSATSTCANCGTGRARRRSRGWSPRRMRRLCRDCAHGRWPGPTPAPGDPIAIAAYLGKKDAFDRAIAAFATGLRRPQRARLRAPQGGRRQRTARGPDGA